MALRNVFGNLALDATVQSIVSWLTARTGSKTTANSVAVNIASDQTVPVSAAALPLPTGAATSAKQDTIIGYVDGLETSTSSIDGKLPALNSGRIPVDIGNANVTIGASVEVSNDAGNPLPVSDAGGSLTVDGEVSIVGTAAVSAASLPLPAGASTAANQSTANTSLASLDGKAPALVSGRVPVDGSGVTQPVSGPLTDTQLRASAVTTAPNISRGTGVMDANTTRVTLATDGPTVSALNSIDSKTPALVSGRQPVDGSGVTQPISAASLPLPTGAATSANQSTANTSLGNIDTDLGAQADTAASTDTGTFSLIALVKRGLQNWTTLLGRVPSLTVSSTRLLVDGSGVTQPVSATALPLPSGAATSALQTTGNTSLSSIDGKLAALQSGAMPVGDNSGSLTVDSKTYRATVSITRPSDTTAYTAGDVFGSTGGSAIHTLSSIGPSAGYVLIQSVSLTFSDASVPSGMAAFRVHLYSASPTAIADNAVFDLLSADRANYLGYIDLPTPSDLGSSLYTQADYCGRLVKLASASTSLFAEIETRGGYTPASASTVLLAVNALEAGL